LEELGDPRIRVGVFSGRELDELRRDVGALDRWILPVPTHAFDELPALLAAADLSCALQSPDHPVSRYQMPAKVTDAMAMGVPCLVTPVPPLLPLIDKDVLEVFEGDGSLAERLQAIFANAEETADRARRSRDVFLESYSYAAVRPAIDHAVGHLLDRPPPLAPALASLSTTMRTQVRPGTVAPPRPRPRVPAGAGYDLVVFWKQNDTGIYGRRQDMFLKYLERSGRFHTIVHFDQPMSAEALAGIARRGVGATDQNRLVLRQTVRRLAHRNDRGPLRQRTFLYAGSRASRLLRLPARDAYPDFVTAVLEREGIGRRPLLCWVYPTNELFPAVADALQPDVVVADVVDDNRTWYEPGTERYERLERNYADVLARSDIVLANCEPVAESMRAFTPRVEVVANACELPDDARPPARPRDLEGLRSPIIGYAGNLSDRIDLPLLHHLVRARREWSFVFLGSTHRDRAVLALAEEPNVRFLGTKRYDEAQAIIRHFDVGLIPHVDNDMTRSMNPLKAYVYCALGVPIVSTPVANIGEMADFITVAEGADGFLEAIEQVLESERTPPDREALRPHSWEERVARVLSLVDEVASTRPEG
jgi:glycosyltransferase involved in cell wall biosynthesis